MGTDVVIGYHFLRSDPADRHPEDRDIVIGETLRKTRPIKREKYGYHASERPMDALRAASASGPIATKVLLSGQILYSPNESVASERTVLGMCDATGILERFARRCALDVIGNWDAPAAVMEYLLTADETLAADALSVICDICVSKLRGKVVTDEQLRDFVRVCPAVPEIAFVYGAVTSGTVPLVWSDYDSYSNYSSIYASAQVAFCDRPVPLPWQRPVTLFHRTREAFKVMGCLEERPNCVLAAMLEDGFRAERNCH